MFNLIVLTIFALSSVHAQGSASKQFGSDDRNVVLGGFASQPAGGPPTLGGDATFNTNKHAASIGGSHTLGVGSQVTGAGRLNLIDSNPHRLDANAFHTQNIPNHGRNFGTTGGGLDYRHASGHGVSGSVAHTPAFRQTDTSIQGNLNLYRDKSSSLDANVGRSQSFSPYGNSRPNHFGGITYSRNW